MIENIAIRKIKFFNKKKEEYNEYKLINQVDSEVIDFEIEFELYTNEEDEKGNSKRLDGKWNDKTKSSPILADFNLKFNK